MPRNRTQRYRLTYEFVLRDRSTYSQATGILRDALHVVEESFLPGLLGDYLAIEKIEESPPSPTFQTRD